MVDGPALTVIQGATTQLLSAQPDYMTVQRPKANIREVIGGGHEGSVGTKGHIVTARWGTNWAPEEALAELTSVKGSLLRPFTLDFYDVAGTHWNLAVIWFSLPDIAMRRPFLLDTYTVQWHEEA